MAQESWYIALRDELTTWHRRGRIDDACWVQDGVRGIAAMERDVLVLEAHSLGCAGSVAQLAGRVLDLEHRPAGGPLWRVDTQRMTITGSIVQHDAQLLSLDEIAARMVDVMGHVRRAKPFLDGRRIAADIVDLDCRAGQIDAWIRCEIRMVQTKPKRLLPPFVLQMRREIERALGSALGFSKDELQHVVDCIGAGQLDEEELRRLIGYLEAEREAYDLVARFGPTLDRQRVDRLICAQEYAWGDISLRALSRHEERTTSAADRLQPDGAPVASASEPKPAHPAHRSASVAAAIANTAAPQSGTTAAPVVPSEPKPPRLPQEFAQELSSHVIGQPDAVSAWALALHQHEAGVQSRGAMLMDGPTGCGKSYIGTCAAVLAGVPFIHINAASLVPEGIVGQTLSDVCIAAISQSDGKVELAERSIVLFDEVDKLSTVVTGDQGTRYATTIIHQLLRFMDGCEYAIDDYKTSERKKMPKSLSTRRMLIAFAGAWTCLRGSIQTARIGFNDSPVESDNGPLSVTDLGLPLEFVGRVSRLVHLQPHTIDSLMSILRSEAASPLREVRDYLTRRKASLTIDDQLLTIMAQDAMVQGTGARGLVTIAQTFTDCIYWNGPFPGKRFHLTGNGTLQVEQASIPAEVAA